MMHVQGSRPSAHGFIVTRNGKRKQKKKEVVFEIADIAGDSRLLKKVPHDEAERLRKHIDCVPPPPPVAVFASTEEPEQALPPVTVVVRASITVVLPSRTKGPACAQQSCSGTGLGKDVQYRHGPKTRKALKAKKKRHSDHRRGRRMRLQGPCSKRASWKDWKAYQFGWYV